jgi:hypothetical protein
MKKRVQIQHLGAAAVSCYAPAALAHGGHGVVGAHSILHYFVEPLHAVIWLGLALAVALLWGVRRRQRRDRQ